MGLLFSVADWLRNRIPGNKPHVQSVTGAAAEPRSGWRATCACLRLAGVAEERRGIQGDGGVGAKAHGYGPISSGICFPPLSHANTDLSSYGKPTITETSPKKLCRSVTDGVAGPLGCEWTMPT